MRMRVCCVINLSYCDDFFLVAKIVFFRKKCNDFNFLRKFYVDFSRFSCTVRSFAVSLQRFKNGGSPLRESIGQLLGISSAGFFCAPRPSGKAGDVRPGSFPRGRNSLPSWEKNSSLVEKKYFPRGRKAFFPITLLNIIIWRLPFREY